MQRLGMQCAAWNSLEQVQTFGGWISSHNNLCSKDLCHAVRSPKGLPVARRLPVLSPTLMYGSRRALVHDPASPALQRPSAAESAPVLISERGSS